MLLQYLLLNWQLKNERTVSSNEQNEIPPVELAVKKRENS
jgi:hypothetical protein